MSNYIIDDVAKEAKVSLSTVSKVINNYKQINERTREKVLEAVKKLHYSPNPTARKLKLSADKKLVNRNFGFLISEQQVEAYKSSRFSRFNDPYYGLVMAGAMEETLKLKLKLTSEIVINNYKETLDIPLMIRDGVVDGVITVGDFPDKFFKDAINSNVPVVSIESYTKVKGINRINVDNVQGSYDAVKYLIDNGHKKIGFISGFGMDELVTQERLKGLKLALEDNGLDYNLDFIEIGDFAFNAAEAVENLLKKGHLPTAIFARDDMTAIEAMESFIKHGLKVPDDISFVGLENIIEAQYINPPLTTMRTPRHEMGKLAVRRLHELINDKIEIPLKTLVPLELIERKSVRKI